MNSATHHFPASLAALSHESAARRTARVEIAGFVQESHCSRVVRCVKALLEALRVPAASDCRGENCQRLVGVVVLAFVEGDLKPGDPFPNPAELAQACNIPLAEALDAVAYLMNRRILQQDFSGALHIPPLAAPTLEMKQQAFLVRARQLVGQARQWHLSSEGVRVLLDQAGREAS